MAKVLCTITDCKYCGRKSGIHICRNGEPLYTCKRKTIQIRKPFDMDNNLFNLVGTIAGCMFYEQKK